MCGQRCRTHSGRSDRQAWRGAVVLTAAAACLALPEPALAGQGGGASPLRVPACRSPVTVDGVLDDDAWQEALVVELPFEIDPGENVPARVRTICMLTADTRNLYIACRAFDPDPAAIRAHYRDRDTADDDDWLLFSLDTFADQRRAFELRVNPLGVQMDSQLNELGGAGAEIDPTWDAIWSSAGRITAAGYEVESAVPFTSLRFPAAAGEQRWGLQIMRHWPRRLSHFFRATPWNRDRACTLCESIPVVGMADAASGLRLELDPTLTAQRSLSRASDAAPLAAESTETEAGLTVRWGIMTDLSLLAAANPDFSQVEADAAQLDVNTRFALFYPERRPFFLEGADVLATPLKITHTRTIADPAWGVKLSGKQGRHAFAVLAARDEQTNLLLPANQSSSLTTLDQPATAAVARYRLDLGSQSAIGVLATHRQGQGYGNRVAGVDGMLRVTPTDTVAFQALHARSRYPETGAAPASGGPLEGWAASLAYRHEARSWSWWASYQDLGAEFRADLGFIPRVGTRISAAGLQRTIWPSQRAWFGRINLGAEASHTSDHSGQLSDRYLLLRGEVSGPLRSSLLVRVVSGDESFGGRLLSIDSASVEGSFYPVSSLRLGLAASHGDAIDYRAGRPGTMLRLGVVFDGFLGRHLQVRLEPSLETLDVAQGRVYEATLAQARVAYQFNQRTFVRLILQHLDADQGAAGVAEGSSSFLVQALFSWKLNPQTVFFFGYGSNQEGVPGEPMRETGRTWFAKLGYAIDHL